MSRLLAIFVVGLMMLTPALASEEEKSEEPEQGESEEERKEESLSFSNADLERRYGAGTKKEPAESATQPSPTQKESAAAGQTALDKMFSDQAASKERAGKLTEAEAVVAAARARVAQLEKKSLQVVNPLLPRPAPPEDAEEAERWKAMNGAERSDATKAELAEARKELAEAEAALAAARGN